jgi:hypothetical protein
MARKSTPRARADSTSGNVIDRLDVGSSIPPTPSEARPGSVFSLEMVNVFGEPVTESSEATGVAPGVRLQLTAWVNNVSYLKDVWVDAYLTDASGAVAHKEALLLDYREGAGGGGDFFVLDAEITAAGARGATGRKAQTPPVTTLQYRLYYQIGDTVFAEGILHELPIGTPGGQDLQLTAAPSEPVSQAPMGPAGPAGTTWGAGPVPVGAGDGAPGKSATASRAGRATRKAAASAPEGSDGTEAAPKRTLRRRPSS